MKFTITQRDLAKMLNQVGKKAAGAKKCDPILRLSACAARVFVESNQMVAGVESLVLSDGLCTLQRKLFTSIIKTYAGRTILMIEADQTHIQIANTQLPVLSYSSNAIPPANFRVFPVTDTWVTGESEPSA